MALIEVVGAIKLEPSVIKAEALVIKLEQSVIKSEPSSVVEIHPADICHSSDEEDEDKKELEKEYISETKTATHEAKDEDGRRDNNFLAAENVLRDERLVLNFNKQVRTADDISNKNSNSGKINWANIYRTRESTNCSEEARKVKKVYGSSWSKPIKEEEYTFISKTSMICNYCHREFGDKKNLARHIRGVHRESSITHHCPYCPKKSKWSLRSHIIGNHKNENEIKWFQCYLCDKKYAFKKRLEKHIHTHLGTKKQSGPATCPTCGNVFKTRRSMQTHIEKVHLKRHQCDKCSFVGQHLSSLKYHIDVCHTDPSELPILQCSKCDFKTKYRNVYYSHAKKHETTLICDKCSFMSNSRTVFKLHENIHKKKIDDETLKYRCKKCDYKTYRSYSLQVHELNHLKPEEIKYFYCYHCNFKAKRKDNLKTHIIRHFKNEEVSLQCFVCDFETKKRPALTKHIKGHQNSPQVKGK